MPSSNVSPDPLPPMPPGQPSPERQGASPRTVALTLGSLVVVAFAIPTFFAVNGEISRYRQVGALSVLWTQWAVEGALFLVGALIAWLLIRASLVVAYRTRPIFLPLTEEDMLFENYRGSFDRYRRQIERVVPVIVAVFVGVTAGGQWRKAMLWWHGTTFGAIDPYFGKDAGFYVFTLPWLRFLAEFATMCLALSLLAATAAHVVNGGIAMRGIALEGGRRTTRAARVHLSVLLAALFLTRAAAATLARYALATQSGDRFGGMTYTAEHVLEPAHAALAVIAACVAGLFLSVLRTDSIRIPATSAAVFAVVSIGGLQIAAPLYDQTAVQPHVGSLEQVQARQAMTAQDAAFSVTNAREGALDVGAVSKNSQSATSTVVTRLPSPPALPDAGTGQSSDTQTSDTPDGSTTVDGAVARLGRAAPWLTWDRHPYLVGSGSQQVWLVDGYTTTADYPGSQGYQFGAIDQDGSGTSTDASPVGETVNYVRNAVKATVNRQTGAVTLYAWNPKEPILRAWEGVFHPHLEPASRMPAYVTQALRYPQELFTVQRDVLARYHSRSTADFLTGSSWQAASGPDAQPTGAPATPIYGPISGRDGKVTDGLSSALVTNNSQLAGVLTATDASAGSVLTLSTVPASNAGSLPDPGAWSRSIRTSTQPGVGTSRTLPEVLKEAEKRGTVSFGPVLVVQVDSGVLYAEQITSTGQTPGARPRVIAVALRSGSATVWASSGNAAVQGLVTKVAGSDASGSAIAEAQQALADANAAQARGDDDAYNEAAHRLDAALKRVSGGAK